MPLDQQENSSADSEGQFYNVLAQSGMSQEDVATFAAVQRDFFDASIGVQSGIRSDGVPVLMLTLTPEGVKMVVDAATGWQSHNCHHGPEVGLYLLHVAADTLRPLLASLPKEIQDLKPFGH